MATQEYSGAVKQSSNSGDDGIVTLSPNAETVTGTANNTAVTPLGLAAALGPRTLRGVLLGQGLGASQTATAAGSNGQVLIASSVGQPAFAGLSSSDGTIIFTAGSNSLGLQAVGGGLTWTVQTGSTQALVKSTGTFSNSAGSAVAFTLPSTAAVGDTFEVCNMGARAAGFTIGYNAGQYIRFGNITTTTTTGSLAASATGDAVRLVCSVANTEFVVTPGSMGNLTYV